MKNFILISITIIALLLVGCKDDNKYQLPTLSKEGVKLPHTVLKTTATGVEIRNGGYGSAAVAHPTNAGEFYAMTDRGPNTKVSGGKIFPTPNYNPRIGHFKLNTDGTITKIEDILFKNPNGGVISGRPNPEGKGATGEVPYDEALNVLSYDDYGLDAEGLVALKDGTFWISDEYGPHIVHFDANGKEMERISPVGVNTGSRKLPAVFKRRWPNRGMEGLAITPDEKTLVGIMQSTLYNPSKAEVADFTITRIVTFNLETAATKQYLYKQDKAKNANSEITALSSTEFLVVERDTKFQGKEAGVDVQKKIYRVDISKATDVSESMNAVGGKMINGKTLEQSTWDEITAAGIVPAAKTLAVDLVKEVNYPHDKLEGIWLIDNNTIGVVNDDDFAVAADGSKVVQKYLYTDPTLVDGNTLYIVKF